MSKYCGTCNRFKGNHNDSSLNAPVICPRKGKVVTATTNACKSGWRPIQLKDK